MKKKRPVEEWKKGWRQGIPKLRRGRLEEKMRPDWPNNYSLTVVTQSAGCTREKPSMKAKALRIAPIPTCLSTTSPWGGVCEDSGSPRRLS